MHKFYYLNLKTPLCLGILFLKICHGKFCFVNYFVKKRTLTLKRKKQLVSSER